MEQAKEAIEGSIEEAMKASKAATDSILNSQIEKASLTRRNNMRSKKFSAACSTLEAYCQSAGLKGYLARVRGQGNVNLEDWSSGWLQTTYQPNVSAQEQ